VFRGSLSFCQVGLPDLEFPPSSFWTTADVYSVTITKNPGFLKKIFKYSFYHHSSGDVMNNEYFIIPV
jgi:hypothetical protein